MKSAKAENHPSIGDCIMIIDNYDDLECQYSDLRHSFIMRKERLFLLLICNFRTIFYYCVYTPSHYLLAVTYCSTLFAKLSSKL